MNEKLKKFEQEILDELKRCCEKHYETQDMLDFYTGAIYELKEMLQKFYTILGKEIK